MKLFLKKLNFHNKKINFFKTPWIFHRRLNFFMKKFYGVFL